MVRMNLKVSKHTGLSAYHLYFKFFKNYEQILSRRSFNNLNNTVIESEMEQWIMVLVPTNTECIFTITVINHHQFVFNSHQTGVNHRHLETIYLIPFEHFNKAYSSKISTNYAFIMIWCLNKFKIQGVRISNLL